MAKLSNNHSLFCISLKLGIMCLLTKQTKHLKHSYLIYVPRKYTNLCLGENTIASDIFVVPSYTQ